MDFTEWSKLALICSLGAMSPGPSLAVIIRNSIFIMFLIKVHISLEMK